VRRYLLFGWGIVVMGSGAVFAGALLGIAPMADVADGAAAIARCGAAILAETGLLSGRGKPATPSVAPRAPDQALDRRSAPGRRKSGQRAGLTLAYYYLPGSGSAWRLLPAPGARPGALAQPQDEDCTFQPQCHQQNQQGGNEESPLPASGPWQADAN